MSGAAVLAPRPGVWKRLRRRRGSGIALAVLLGTVLVALLAPALPLPPPATMVPAGSNAGPAGAWAPVDVAEWAVQAEDHPWFSAARSALFGDHAWVGVLGSDGLGRDVLARVVWGGRVSLMVGLVATLVSVLVGVAWGALAGLLGGRTDNLMMRVVDALYSVPLLFLVILAVALMRELVPMLRVEYGLDIDRLLILYLVIGAVSWLTMARVVRGQVLALRTRDFVTAAEALGCSKLRILIRHLLPNLWGIVVVYLTLTIPRVILFEAFLSFLGLGVEPPGVSWGILAAEGLESLTAVSVTWWLVVFPGLALVLTLSALNSLGDGLRDALDPRTSQL